MNILKISTIDTRGGGSKIPWNLMLKLREKGHQVSMFVGFKYSSDLAVKEIPRNPFFYRLSKYLADDLRFSFSDRILSTDEYKKADIVHFHNIHSGFFNWSTFEKIVKEKKCVWTAHDLWPITSGCTTSIGCKTEDPKRLLGFLWDNRPHMLNERKRVYANSRFHVVSPSHWIDTKIADSIMSKMPRTVILNGIDTDIFKPQDKMAARRKLGLPLDKKIIMHIATGGLKNWLKGGDLVAKMADAWSGNESIVFVAVGHKDISQGEQRRIGNVIMAGNLEDERVLAEYYSEADVLVYPTRADNCPLVILESMACGTPVVSFATDGVPEIIGDLGHIAPYEDFEGLLAGTKKMLALNPAAYTETSRACSARIAERYALPRMAEEYDALYTQILNEK